jgi:flagellar hook-associated protein 1 FlgK
MTSNELDFGDNEPLLSTDANFQAGTFDVVAYDIDGKVVGRRSITINSGTVMDNATSVMSDGVTPNSVVEQLQAQKDDNSDNNGLNDLDDILNVSFATPSNVFSIGLKGQYSSLGYTFAIEDKGTNFAGVTGVSRFFDGSDGSNITLSSPLQVDPAKISAHKSPVAGDNQTALDMVQLQFSQIDFKESYRKTSTDTIYGFYDDIVTRVGTRTNSAITTNMSVTAQFNAIQQEYDSISKVSIDEEMANLIRYQTSYGAAAKVITTIDQMMTTLLGLKQ